MAANLESPQLQPLIQGCTTPTEKMARLPCLGPERTASNRQTARVVPYKLPGGKDTLTRVVPGVYAIIKSPPSEGNIGSAFSSFDVIRGQTPKAQDPTLRIREWLEEVQ